MVLNEKHLILVYNVISIATITGICFQKNSGMANSVRKQNKLVHRLCAVHVSTMGKLEKCNIYSQVK